MIELNDLLSSASAVLVRPGPTSFPGATINSNETAPGELFFALHGTRDGHNFVLDAVRAGAAGVVLEREVPGIPPGTAVVRVPDTLAALQRLGAATRARSSATVIAVTGSAGKTTTKSLIAHVLGSRFPVLSNKKSFNNHLGVPLSLAEITPEHSHVVTEVGTNHRGEIDTLSRLIRPDIGVVTNVGFAHIGNFLSRADLAAEKTDLLRNVGPGGRWIVNGDDELLDGAMLGQPSAAGVTVVRVGFDIRNDIRVDEIHCDESGTSGVVIAEGETVRFKVSMPGRHFAYAVLFSLAVARACGLDIRDAVETLQAFNPPRGRASIARPTPNLLILDDSYNASPDATLAALDLLGALPAQVRVAVLGEMRELGDWSDELHALVGQKAAATATHLVAVGPGTRHLVEAAGRAGFDSAHIWTADSARAAYATTQRIASAAENATCAILAKGARFMHMERVPLGLSGITIGCSLQVCQLYIHCRDCPKLEAG